MLPHRSDHVKEPSSPRHIREEIRTEARRRPAVTAVYLILRLIVIVTMVSAIRVSVL